MEDDFRIVVAIDFEAGTDRVLAEAARYAVALNAIADVIHVVAPEPGFIGYPKIADSADAEQEDSIRNSKARQLRAEHSRTQMCGEALRRKGVRVDRALTIQGATLATILEEIGKVEAQLLIVGFHREHSALYRLWFGDSAVEAVKQARCAVLVVPIPE